MEKENPRGKDGGGGKGKGKNGPKGGCYTCGGDHYAENCPKLGKGDPQRVYAVHTLCQVSEEPVQNRYAELNESNEEEVNDHEGAVERASARESVLPPPSGESWEASLRKRQSGTRKLQKKCKLVSECRGCCDAKHPSSARTLESENKLGSLVKVSTAMAHAVGEAPEWEELDMIVDSGASVTVINNDIVRAVDAGVGKPG